VALRQDFPVSFYAAGPRPRLRALWRYLQAQPVPVKLERQERRDLFQAELLEVLAIEAPGILEQERLFARASQDFPDLTYYDADISLPLRHAARYGTFPLAKLRVSVDEQERVQAIERWTRPGSWTRSGRGCASCTSSQTATPGAPALPGCASTPESTPGASSAHTA